MYTVKTNAYSAAWRCKRETSVLGVPLATSRAKPFSYFAFDCTSKPTWNSFVSCLVSCANRMHYKYLLKVTLQTSVQWCTYTQTCIYDLPPPMLCRTKKHCRQSHCSDDLRTHSTICSRYFGPYSWWPVALKQSHMAFERNDWRLGLVVSISLN